MFYYHKGSVLNAQQTYIVQQVNCRGVMGAGLAKQIREQYPKLYNEYKQICLTNIPGDLLGKVFAHENILSVFGQLDYGRDPYKVYTNYGALRIAFNKIHVRLPLSASLAFPTNFGCGLANGDWTTVRKLIEDCFIGRDIHFYTL